MKIIRDTREQQGWDFAFYDVELDVRTLKTGDYTTEFILQSEVFLGRKILVVERKASTGEMSNNLGFAKKRFTNELKRMSEYDNAFLICEFSIDDLLAFPERSNIPKKQWRKLRITGKYMYSELMSYADKYGIEVIFSEHKADAESKALDIMTRVEMMVRNAIEEEV